MHPLNLNSTSRNNSQTDPYAAAFLHEQLGEAKWSIFSARLFERRLGSSRNKSRSKVKNGDSEFNSSGGGATAIDFLVKVEVVKEVLRTYVPHPYNPLKSLSHAYERSPGGYVTLTRSTVLVLSGWSNTQFSYWARRSEGISVLAVHDHRLRAVALALERRLRAENLACSSLDATQNMLTTLDAATEEQSTSVTGKGLDIIIEEIKKNKGASPFLRGKHSSLDPFGSTNTESDTGIHTSGSPHPHPNATAPVYMPTFQAMEYTHSPSIALPPLRKRKTRRAGTSCTQVVKPISIGEGQDLENNMQHFSYPISEPRTMTPESTSSSEIQSVASVSPTFISSLHSHRAAAMKNAPMHHNTEESGGLIQETENTTREYFPVSDSRSDPEVRSHRKRLSDFSEDDVRKRLKQNE
ncbi:hypothetical protein SERLADRAFT_410465 [Serpula lacrymans var. lacrymans S7.9]|nr:uncharacterized protein SERLADRAFT_410465 [Serpula lacrymans var. lacrymans S7.9]EGO20888.1 hypothetical protein SERLADRAFT_410465 [Serpula lacrymans var. lacrymans S7.9]